MENSKYYLIAKSIHDRYIETNEYVNVYDFANHVGEEIIPIDRDEIVDAHIANMTYLYYDEFNLDDDEWDFVIKEFTKMVENEFN